MNKITKKVNEIYYSWRGINKKQKISVAVLFLMLIFVPLGVFASLNQVNFFSRGYLPITPPTTPPTTPPVFTPMPTSSPPSPVLNNNTPVIKTSSLPSGYKGGYYVTKIIGYDLDYEDELRVYANGYPDEMTFSDCKVTHPTNRFFGFAKKGKTIVTCTLSGKIVNAGTYKIGLIIADRKSYSYKTLTLKVSNKSKLIKIPRFFR